MRLATRIFRFPNRTSRQKVSNLESQSNWFRLLKLEDKIAPATITVSTDIDGAPAVDGLVTLREALESINVGSSVNADVIPVGSYGSSDSITFSGFFSTSRTILLTSTLAASKSVIIDGPAAELIVSGQNSVQVMTVNNGVIGSSAFTIQDLTLSNGSAVTDGGALRVFDEALTLNNVKLINSKSTGNGGGLAMAGGTLNINGSTLSGNKSYFVGGGGMSLYGTNATITASTISGNSASLGTANYSGYGGGIVVIGAGNTLTILGSTISGNSAIGSGAGGYGGYGGGIATYVGTTANINVINSTISGNTANQGAAAKDGGHGGGIAIGFNTTTHLSIQASTLAFNKASKTGGNLSERDDSFPIQVSSTIISNGTAPTGPDIFNPSTSSITLTYSLVSNTTGAFITPHASNKLNVAADLDPVLQLNGGTTANHATLSSSPARDAGDDAITGPPLNLMFDQRGAVRKSGAHVDIGAFENQIDPNIPSAIVSSAPDITTAGVTSETITITYSDNVSVNAATIGDGDIRVISPLGQIFFPTLIPPAPGSGPTAVANYKFSAPYGGSFRAIDAGTYSIEIVAGQVQDNTATSVPPGQIGSFKVGGFAGTIIVDEVSDIVDGDFGVGKVSLREAIKASNNNPGQVDTVTFDTGIGKFDAPRTIVVGTQLSISNSIKLDGPAQELTLDGNNAVRLVSINDSAVGSKVDITNLTLTKGKTGNLFPNDAGGGLQMQDENVTLTNVKVTNCASQTSGGGIAQLIAGGILTLNNCIVSGNSTNNNGGGIFVRYAGSKLNVNNSTISGNSASLQGGGGIAVFGCTANVTNSTIANNTAQVIGYGGGMLIFGTGAVVNVTGCTISGNLAKGSPTVSYGGYGGGIAAFDSTVTIINSTISGNSAISNGSTVRGGYGGGLLTTFNNSPSVTIRNTTIAFNTADIGGNISTAFNSTPSIILYSAIVSNGTANKGATQGHDIHNSTPINATYSLIGNATGSNITPNATNVLNVDPLLDPTLQFNNGGLTKTHALKAGSKAIDFGDNAVGMYLTDQNGKTRTVNDPAVDGPGDKTDIGAFEVQQASAPPTVVSVLTNGAASGQHSMVQSIVVTFSGPVTIANPAAAFNLFLYEKGAGGITGSVGLTISSVVGNSVTITFNKSGAVTTDPGNSLQDGRYRLTIFSTEVVGAGGFLDGNGNGKYDPLDPNSDNNLSTTWRLFGDSNGDGNVNGNDFTQFRLVFGTTSPPFYVAFNYFGGATPIGGTEFAEFRKRFGLNGYAP